mgnify:CR=1 FL=1
MRTMERNIIKVYTKKYNPKLFSTAEHHIRSKGNSKVNFECVNNSVTESNTDIAFDLVNDIVNS